MTDLIAQKLLLAFEGVTVTDDMREMLGERAFVGLTLFRHLNIEDKAQIRELTAVLQQTHPHPLPLLIAADQEGGQLMALGDDTTPFPGNMALGATGDIALAEQVGFAIGQEMAAMGVNVNYAPVCDVNSNPRNPNVGIRAFSDNPHYVGQMAQAMIAGLQRAGVAATAKHFPGNGESETDPHYGIPVYEYGKERLWQTELYPFRQATNAKLMMTGHHAIPAITGRDDLPATLSREVMTGLLREQMGFAGVIISDAFDMGAITQGDGQLIDAIAAVNAGVDILLLTANRSVQNRLHAGLQQAISRSLVNPAELNASVARIQALRSWLGMQEQPDLSVVGCEAHHALAQQVADKAITLVRNEVGLLPLQLEPKAKVAVIVPKPKDLTPADTSSYVVPTLAQAIRAHHAHVNEWITSHPPTPNEIAELQEKVAEYDLVIVGTISAHLDDAQAQLVEALHQTAQNLITVALRTPYDLCAYPNAQTHICTYSLQEPAMNALANCLWGKKPFEGSLPVTIPDLYAIGHTLSC